jgi:DNA-binding transcriptional regulator YiaG
VEETAKQQVLRKAADLVGREQLAVLLKVPKTTLDAWLEGQASMPDRKLRMLGDVLDDMTDPKQ